MEVGLGKGCFAAQCRSRNLDYIGIEPSQDLYIELKQAGFEIINEVVPPIPVENESVDIVYSDQFVEHLCSYREVMELFLETKRVLKPGGYTLVITPNYQTIKHLFFLYEYQHTYITTKYRLKNLLIDSGFEIVNDRCFLFWPSQKLNWADRLLANIMIPISTNSLFQGLVSTFISEKFMFRVHKNMFDRVAILARKPSSHPA